jgi:hypothetical protein
VLGAAESRKMRGHEERGVDCAAGVLVEVPLQPPGRHAPRAWQVAQGDERGEVERVGKGEAAHLECGDLGGDGEDRARLHEEVASLFVIVGAAYSRSTAHA